MTEIARMRFVSMKNPKERGMLLLQDDGTLQIKPTDELRDEMARREEAALHRSRTFGTQAGLGLMTLGMLALGAGWLAGRVFGKLGQTLSEPRPITEVELTRDDGGGVHLSLRGSSRWQRLQMAWNGDEVLQGEADNFAAKFDEMRQTL